jgi:hypothetical protein
MYKAAYIVNLQLIQPFPKPWYGGMMDFDLEKYEKQWNSDIVVL